MSELVSILIPVYNCSRWVGRAIETALEQTWPDIEVIALDDASTDGSWQVLQEWNSKIRVERAHRNGGQNVSRNLLTTLSSGVWLQFLDADDELALDAVEKKMRSAAVTDAIYGTMEVRHYDGDEVTFRRRITAEAFADPLAAAFLWKYPNTSSFMFRRSALLDAGGWNEFIQNCTDYDLYFRLLLANKRLRAAPESVTVYRHWSQTQAVYENSLRRTTTRLELMWRSVLQLEQAGRLTMEVRDSFCNAALTVIRTLHQIEQPRALQEHRRLKSWNDCFAPSPVFFPKGYCTGYRLLGFRGAEFLARLTRFLRPTPPKGLFMTPAKAADSSCEADFDRRISVH